MPRRRARQPLLLTLTCSSSFFTGAASVCTTAHCPIGKYFKQCARRTPLVRSLCAKRTADRQQKLATSALATSIAGSAPLRGSRVAPERAGKGISLPVPVGGTLRAPLTRHETELSEA